MKARINWKLLLAEMDKEEEKQAEDFYRLVEELKLEYQYEESEYGRYTP